MKNIDKAIEAAAEALERYERENPGQRWHDFGSTIAASIAVEAAFPVLYDDYHSWLTRAERAEAEVERLRAEDDLYVTETAPPPHEHVYRCQDCGEIGRGQ